MRRFREPARTGSEPVADRFRQPVPEVVYIDHRNRFRGPARPLLTGWFKDDDELPAGTDMHYLTVRKKFGMQTAWPRPFGSRHRVAGAMMFSARGTRPRRGSLGEIMRTKIQRLVLLVMLVGGLLVALSAPANAATNQISGVAV